MQGRRRGLSFIRGDQGLEFGASLFDLLKLLFPRLVAEPVQQQFENLLRASVDGGQLARRVCLLCPALRTQPVSLGDVQPRPFVKALLGEEAALEGGERYPEEGVEDEQARS